MFTVEDLYKEDITEKIINISGGKELRGPCPGCGGDDRFGVFPHQNDGKGSYYCGRGSLGGNGCGKGGDIIQYLRDFRGMSYKDACGYLGIEAKGGGGKHMRYISPKMPKQQMGDHFVPELKQHPEEVVDPTKWREHGMKFVDSCHAALLARPTAIDYLSKRGISIKAVIKFKLGFHHGETRGDKMYQPSFRPWPSWGMASSLSDKGKTRKIILPAGLVIPYIVDGQLHRITIRLVKPDPKQPKKKYHYVRGSIRDLWLSNPTAKAFVIQEGELDCIAVDDAAGDLVGVVGLGSTGIKPDKPTKKALDDSICILGGLDFDPPRENPSTGKIERPGASAGPWWEKQYPQYKRWPVSVGKDAGEAFAKGIDLRMWIMSGLPPVFQEAEVVHRPAVVEQLRQDPEPEIIKDNSDACFERIKTVRFPVSYHKTEELSPQGSDIPSPKNEKHHQGRIEQLLKEKKSPQTEEVLELRKLLTQAEGFIRIYGQGTGIGPVVSPDWSEKNNEKRSRISWLLFNSESVAQCLGNLTDGMYGPDHLCA